MQRLACSVGTVDLQNSCWTIKVSGGKEWQWPWSRCRAVRLLAMHQEWKVTPLPFQGGCPTFAHRASQRALHIILGNTLYSIILAQRDAQRRQRPVTTVRKTMLREDAQCKQNCIVLCTAIDNKCGVMAKCQCWYVP